MNQLLYHDPSIRVMASIIGNVKSNLLFLESFLEKIVFGPLVSSLVLSHSAYIFLVKLLLEEPQFVQRFEKKLMVLHH